MNRPEFAVQPPATCRAGVYMRVPFPSANGPAQRVIDGLPTQC